MIIFFLIVYLIVCFNVFSQNQWIDYSKQYFRIPISKTGIYRITRQSLEQAGFPINNISPKNIQLFGYGKEQPIYIKGEEDLVFNYDDYIEFFGRANDGWYDSLLYENPQNIVNPYYSLINDTIYYFITWNNSVNNLRAKFETDTNYTQHSQNIISSVYRTVKYHDPSLYYYGEIGCWYNEAEGWASYYCDLLQPLNISLYTPYFKAGLPWYLNFCCISVSNSQYIGAGNHHLKVLLNNNVIFDSIFSGLKNIKKSFTFNSVLQNNTYLTIQSVNDLNLSTDKIAVGYVTIRYPSEPNFTGINFFDFNENVGTHSYLKFLYPQNQPLLLWDYENGIKISVNYNNGYYHALTKNIGNIRRCYITSEDSVINAVVLNGVNYTDYLSYANKCNYIIITNKKLYSSALQYANYRNTTGYNTLVCDVDQLYDQFAFGIPKHPLAIKNFLKLFDNFSSNTKKYVLLIGKGLRWEIARKSPQYYSQIYVPTYGSPPSDFYYIVSDSILNYSIGRISATTNAEVIDYLNKVIQHSTNTCSEWNKYVIHFGGGTNTAEQHTIQGYLQTLKNIIEDSLYGANVFTFLKNTSLPIQTTISDSVKSIINNGCSIITFFGHATAAGFDQNIDYPQNYNNYGKYPLLFANTCFSGDIFQPTKSISEFWTLIPNKGSIAFLASTDISYSAYLFLYAKEFYEQIALKSFNEPIGSIIRKTIRQLTLYNHYDLQAATCYDYIYHGDPAVVLPLNRKPDLFVKLADIKFYPEIIETDIDTFEVKVVITNSGSTVNKPFVVRLKRTYSDNTYDEYYQVRNKCFFKDTLLFKIPVNTLKGAGINNFCATVDIGNYIDECNELNNETCLTGTIYISDITPIYPYEFSIYPYDTVTLKASTGNPFAPPSVYLFEIDTTDLFNSPVKKSAEIMQPGGVIKWKLNFNLNDCTVYFWRVSPKNTIKWKESSFIYIPGKHGWSQAHFFQYKKNRFQYLNYNRNIRKFEFINTPCLLKCQTLGDFAASSYFDYWYLLEGYFEKSSCGPGNYVHVVVIDPYTITPWSSNIENFNHINYPLCPGKNRPDYFFVFPTDNNYLIHLKNFLLSIPDSFYILVYNFRNANFQNWPEETYQTFEMLGAHYIRTVPYHGAYIFFTKKGNPLTTKELTGGPYDTLIFEHHLQTNYKEGLMHSTLIGPTRKWQTLHWRPFALEYPISDTINLLVYGYTFNMDSALLLKLNYSQQDIYNLHDYINANTYPYLRLFFYSNDEVAKTPCQLARWQITYDEIPETAINPQKGYYFYKDTLQEGDFIKFAVATENISDYDMDSLLVKYWILDNTNTVKNTIIRRLKKHPAHDVLVDTLKLKLLGFSKLNSIWYEVNTINPITQLFDQLEKYHFNNYAVKYFYVNTDKINPILDVVFDGRHIMNGEIVSAKPEITITLKDENKFLPLNDTSIFKIFLTNLNTNVEKQIFFSGGNYFIQFYPATLPENKCKVIFKPTLSDGRYRLKVNAYDISGNISGSYDYTIEFEVINKPSITHVLNYPNPFSTSTQFIFILTGSEVPDDLRIQIFTISGRLVKEISKEELGNIRIGMNITEYKWDGTDNYGDKLANGVYFYKVIARINNKDVEIKNSDADKFFMHNFGKLYILR
ncbi:MAG: C25 family cysteine peptidase [Bacteroidales bacterium]|nr:C25 family cysteine peptidase [Bacteroidales bacterium]